MSEHNNRFVYSIVIPTLLAISMFIVAFYFVIIPMFERSMMTQKEEMIVELTNAAWSVLAEYHEVYENAGLSLEEAQARAAEHIGKMRYGQEQKDYFWIITSGPEMVMHPYRLDLNGSDLSNYTDNHENKLFVDAAQLVEKQGAGVIQYYWQWKDDASRVVPKLSYVKGFAEWQWIIGTGVYLEDVANEIRQVKQRLLWISTFIILLIVAILAYVLHQSRQIEEKRKAAEHQLRLSIQKYKSLVDASSESTLMLIDEKIVFANHKLTEMLEEPSSALLGLPISTLFELNWEELVSHIDDPQRSYSFETQLINARAGLENVVISVTQVSQSEQVGHIITVKSATVHERLRLDAEKLSDDVELSLQLMNQPVLNLLQNNTYCPLSATVQEAAEVMAANQSAVIFVRDEQEILGVVTDSDLRSRVLAKGENLSLRLATVMTSPTLSINQNALLHEAVLLFRSEGISHLLVKDNIGTVFGHISHQQCLEMQHNSLSYLMKEINSCSLVADLKRIYNKVPLLVQAMFTSTDNINSISRIITAIADAISQRVIELALVEMGPAPCEFAFVAMGSEGRSEQTLKTDQDNAIIYAEPSDSNKRYFLRLAELVNENLHVIGYARCKGDLMAGNPEWCNALAEWQSLFSHWIESGEIHDALDSSIFFDLRLIYGAQPLVDQLHSHIQQALSDYPPFFHRLAKTVSQQKVVEDKKRIDIKSYLVPIIGYLRLHALKHAIPETNSLLRLEQLVAYGYLSEETAQELENIYKFLMHLRIKWQVTLILDNDWPENSVLINNLTEIERVTLQNIAQQIAKLQGELKSTFRLTEIQAG